MNDLLELVLAARLGGAGALHTEGKELRAAPRLSVLHRHCGSGDAAQPHGAPPPGSQGSSCSRQRVAVQAARSSTTPHAQLFWVFCRCWREAFHLLSLLAEVV